VASQSSDAEIEAVALALEEDSPNFDEKELDTSAT
jgi:hypothetical protein